MLILLGLDSEFGTLEGAVTPLVVDMNLFPKIRKEIVLGLSQNFLLYLRTSYFVSEMLTLRLFTI